MPSFHHGPVEIAYFDEGEGEPIVLVHGFASTKEVNWLDPGWVAALKGRRVIALDNRGHGASAKLYDPEDYRMSIMAEDVRALLDHLSLARADVMGYSMGARITAFLALAHAERVRSAIIGGLGARLIEPRGSADVMVAALEAASLSEVTHPRGRMFRIFAEHTKSDLKALAACARGSRQGLTREQAARIRTPMLVAVGSEDEIAGSAQGLAAMVPGAQALVIEGRDHMRAVGDKAFKSGALKFLGERP